VSSIYGRIGYDDWDCPNCRILGLPEDMTVCPCGHVRKKENSMRELRLHLAEEKAPVYEPHVEKAIQDCSDINSAGKQWAKLEVVPTKLGSVCRVEVGNILSGNFRECKIQTWNYTRDGNGNVHVYKHTHP
jgi:hypothetical protein